MTTRSRCIRAAALLLVLFAGIAGTARADAGAPRLWHGTLVQSLDPPRARAADTPTVEPVPMNGQIVPLSNESTLTLWANTAYRGPIYAGPDPSTHRVGRLRRNTEDGFPEVYLLLQEYANAQGNDWVKIRIPARPNGQTGWVRRSALGPFEISRWLLVVDRRRERLTAYDNGRRVYSAPVGIGKRTTPTPPGRFWVRERFRILDPSSAYWPYAIGTSDYSNLSEWPGGGVVGIHGAWGQPWLIPGRPSHGCIRMHNPDISWLAPRVPVGTPIHII